MIYPTAAKLIAALILGGLGYVLSGLVVPVLPEDTDPGWFPLVNLVIGLLCGWITVGRRAGRGYAAAIGNGLTGGAALLFWGLFVQAGNEMLRLALRKRFDGPIESLLALLEKGAEWGMLALAYPPFTLTLLLGALVAGLAAEYAARVWR